jgi:lysophospholipase L1-like esterase
MKPPHPGYMLDRFWRLYTRRSRLRVRLGELLLLVVMAELAARYFLGLGTPPLFLAHPTIEYLQRPDQDIHRFGNHFFVNHWGMRSDPFPARKQHPNEFRVMVFGDSVVNGGAPTAHEQLATTLLQPELAAALGRPVVVGNISTGSWGPGNWLAYARAYGLFEADVVLLLLSSHDAFDNPGYGPLDLRQYPVHGPVFALEEGINRYLPRFVPAPLQFWRPPAPPAPPEPTAEELAALFQQARSDLIDFIQRVRESGARLHVLLHPTRKEAEAGETSEANWDAGRRELKTLFAEQGVPLLDLQPVMHRALLEGQQPYRDAIHLNAAGQGLLVQPLAQAVMAAAAKP